MLNFGDFISILVINLALSVLLIAWQQRALGPLLNESCPGSGAHYWRHTLAALQLLLPMLLVLLFIDGDEKNAIGVFRTMLICVVFGHLLAIGAIAKMIWRRLVPSAPAPQSPAAANPLPARGIR
ncbi:hypothetical protein [Chitinibacter sp. GC72]|uniref:hypothetical protein n=1 Tax=Chitinibacter sp. GC72 TaxID=1526917 RepID=UPI0012FC0A54|nr:hypothetical protein [Chitinibacter sp. GC72]